MKDLLLIAIFSLAVWILLWHLTGGAGVFIAIFCSGARKGALLTKPGLPKLMDCSRSTLELDGIKVLLLVVYFSFMIKCSSDC